MNSLKNLMILAVLSAVGYGVYISLTRNNLDQGVSGTQKPAATNNFASAAKSTHGSLAVGPASAPNASVAPPLNIPAMGNASSTLSNNTTAAAPAPYQSSSSAPSSSVAYPSIGASLTAPPLSAAKAAGSNASPTSPDGSVAASGNMPSKNNVVNLNPPPSNLGSGAGAGDALPAGMTLPKATPNVAASRGSATSNALPVNTLALPGDSAIAPKTAADDLTQSTFSKLIERAQQLLAKGRYAEVQAALSESYFSTYFNSDAPLDVQRASQIVALLDQLAGTVIYSRDTYLPNSAYTVASGDTLANIAGRCQVPWQLLARINGLMPAGASNEDSPLKDKPLPPGTKLKVIHGPFNAIVRLSKHELTLMVDNRYAARFPIGIGCDQPRLEGKYTVGRKVLKPPYYGPDHTVIAPGDPKNPLGGAWIGLSDTVGIHGTPNPRELNRSDNRGSILVADQDLQDLYGILSTGSQVTIVR